MAIDITDRRPMGNLGENVKAGCNDWPVVLARRATAVICDRINAVGFRRCDGMKRQLLLPGDDERVASRFSWDHRSAPSGRIGLRRLGRGRPVPNVWRGTPRPSDYGTWKRSTPSGRREALRHLAPWLHSAALLPGGMSRSQHRLLGLAVVVLMAVSSVLTVAAHRMPTLDDLALARFVAIGGTAGDICGKHHPRDLTRELMHLCQPAAAPAVAPAMGGLLPIVFRLSRLGRHFLAPVATPLAVPDGQNIRAPPVRA